MGKSKSSAKPAAPVQDVSSIDDIFAGPSKTASSSLNKPSTSSKGKGKALESVPQQSQPAAGDKKKKKAKIAAEFRPDAQTSSTVETVLDPSVRPVEVIAPEVKMSKSGTVKPKKRDRKEVEEDEIFRDSRGDGPSELNALRWS
jgi:hypothetical protein